MRRPDYGSHTEADAGRYEAAHAHDPDAPDPADAAGLDQPPRSQPTATCGVCGRPCVADDWCPSCAMERTWKNTDWTEAP